jgi:hypothetical protein
MDKRKILIQLDSDPQPSVFDRVVAIDAGADEVFSYGGVKPEQVRDLVHGAIFTRRAPDDLKFTALFIGGSDVAAGEGLLTEARKHMIPAAKLCVSILLDANGANTTAAAAVRAAAKHVDIKTTPALVLGGTGPVGQRVALLLARLGAPVRVGSRQLARATAVCEAIRSKVSQAKVEPAATTSSDALKAALSGQALVVAAGAAGVVLLPKVVRAACPELRLAIDLNAVPPVGIEGLEATDKGATRDGILAYGAIGVGGTKMKIHRTAIARLFERNDQILDAEEVYALAESI